MAGLKELGEVLTALETAVTAYDNIMEDGKVDFKDARELPELFMAVRVAVEGVGEIPTEFKDATTEELAVELARAVTLIKKVLLKF